MLGDDVIADLGEIRMAGQNNSADKIPFTLTGAGTAPGATTAELRCNITTNGTPNATVVNPTLTIVASDQLSKLGTD